MNCADATFVCVVTSRDAIRSSFAQSLIGRRLGGISPGSHVAVKRKRSLKRKNRKSKSADQEYLSWAVLPSAKAWRPRTFHSNPAVELALDSSPECRFRCP